MRSPVIHLTAACIAWVAASSALASAAPSTSPTATPPPAVPPVTVVRGFRGVVYDVKDTPAPHATATPTPTPGATPAASLCFLTFSTGGSPSAAVLNPSPGLAGVCGTGAVVAAKEGVKILIAIQSKPFDADGTAPIDAFAAPPTADYLMLTVCHSSCPQVATAGRKANGPWFVQTVVDRHDVVVASRNGYPITTIASKYDAKQLPCTIAPEKKPAADRWCTVVTVPWDVLELPFEQNSTVGVRAALVRAGRNAALGDTTISVMQRSPFRTLPGETAQLDRTDNHRNAYFTQYDQYAAQTQTPSMTQTVRFVPGPSTPSTFTLDKPFTPAAPPSRFPPPNGDVDAPLGQNLQLAGTLSQNNTFVQGLQKAITSGVKIFPKKVGPKFPCESCVTFQTQNSDLFTIPKPSATIDLLNESFGVDDSPLKVETLPDLYAGGALYGANDDGTTLAGILHANPVKGFGSRSSTDSAVSILRARGGATLAAQATVVDHAVAPAPAAPSNTKLNTVSMPHLTTYSVFLADSNPTSSESRGAISNVSPVLRYTYDATEHGSNAFAGVQAMRTSYVRHGDSVVTKVFAGYRAVDAAYHAIDGVQPAYPGVAGPLAAIDLAWQGAQSDAAKVELSGYTANYASALDHYTTRDAKLSVGAGKSISAFYEWSESRISAALTAVSLLGSQLGDTPYQTARASLVQPLLGQTYATRDQTVGVELKTNDAASLKGAFSLGYIFDHEAPSCNVVGAVIECLRSQGRTSSLTAQASFAMAEFTLGGSYKPSFYQGARSTLQSERVYNVALAYQASKCTSLIISASNDAGIVGFSPDGSISSTFSAELDSQTFFRFLGPDLLPTVLVGFSNSFGSDKATYTGINPNTTQRESLTVPFRTHSVSFYTGLRVGNHAFRKTVMPDCLHDDKPAEKK